MSSALPLRIAIVGAGPAGFYAAAHLLASETPVEVDMFDRKPGFRFLGGTELGRDVHRSELRSRYHAVLYAIGAATDRRLGIPGEDLPGSEAATTFVGWDNGHPDHPDHEFDLDV